MRRLVAIAAVYAGPSSGCATPDASTHHDPDVPTYDQDIAPILAHNCMECHRAGGIAPFPLTTYEEVAPFAGQIAAVTAERRMPPSNLDNSGACNTYVGARWLDEEDIATFESWAQAGAPAGPPTDERLESPPPWQLDRVDLTLEMPAPYTPNAARVDDYRCFILDPGLTEDAYITGFEVRLGQPEMVHHMTLFALDSAKDEEDAAAFDAADEGPGFTCFGDTEFPSRWLAGAGPGDRGSLLAEGTGLLMSAGRKTVLQMHYNQIHGTFPDQTAIDLKLEPSVPHEAFVERLAATDLELPPGKPAVVATDTMKLREGFTLWGVWPHMHNLGRQLRVTASRRESEVCLAQVNHYEFHWQQFAFYEQPISVRKGDTLRISCTYDTTSRDTTTTWGSRSEDEMCSGFFYVTEALRGGGK